MFVKPHKVRSHAGKSYTYYQLVEAYRDSKGKPTNRVIAELGRLSIKEAQKLAHQFAKIGQISLDDPYPDEVLEGMRYFGPPLLVERLMEILKLDVFIQKAISSRRLKFDLLSIVRLMLCAHLFKSHSRAEWAVWEWQQKLFSFKSRWPDIEYSHFLRGLHVLAEIKDQIEELLYPHLLGLFDLEIDLVFYDLTSTYVEGRGLWSDILRRGYSRDHRPDCKQVVIGLVVSREGFPLTFTVFEGNQLDQKTLDTMIIQLKKRFSISKCIWVSDAGLLTKENLALLEHSGYPYILGAASGSTKEIRQAIGQTPALGAGTSYRGVNLWDVLLPASAYRRVIVIESDGRKEKNKAILERRLEVVRKGLRALEGQVAEGKLRDPVQIKVNAEKVLHQSRVKKYFPYSVESERFTWTEQRAMVEERMQEGGKYALITNTNLSKEDVVDAYRTLLTVEDAFRILKDQLDCRPIWHKCDENLNGHLVLAVWSYLFFRTLEAMLGRAGFEEVVVPRLIHAVKELRAVQVACRQKPIWRMTKPCPKTVQVFKALGLPDLKAAFDQWAKESAAYDYQPRCRKEKGGES
jgi:transposase